MSDLDNDRPLILQYIAILHPAVRLLRWLKGLRERSRARRRSEIESAALRLFAERGYDGTTVAQVAEAAEVSPRTVSLYFPSKLDLALSYIADSARRLSAACAGRGPGRSTLDVLNQLAA